MSQITQYPPGPSYKILGKLVREFIGDPIKTLTRIAHQYGDISYFKLGREHVYLINNPDYIEKISYTIITISKRVRDYRSPKDY
jgi:hypothetical protein